MLFEVAKAIRELIIDLADEESRAVEKAMNEVLCILEDQMEEEAN